MSETLLTATTDADQSDPVSVQGAKLPYTFHCAPLLAGAEKATVQFRGGNGTWYNLYIEGALQEITATNGMITVFGHGQFRIDKDATAGATGVYGDYENDVGS